MLQSPGSQMQREKAGSQGKVLDQLFSTGESEESGNGGQAGLTLVTPVSQS